MPDTLNVTMRPVQLLDATWQVLDHPRRVTPTFEPIRSAGYWYPADATVTCPNMHTWHTTPDRHGRRELPGGLVRRYRAEVFDPDLGDTYGHDPYWVCSACDTEVNIAWRHTGEIEFTIQSGEELWPSSEVTLRLFDGPVSINTVLSGTYPLLDVDGTPVCEVAPNEWGYEGGPSGGVTVVARIIGAPRESLAALLRAVYGDQAVALT